MRSSCCPLLMPSTAVFAIDASMNLKTDLTSSMFLSFASRTDAPAPAIACCEYDLVMTLARREDRSCFVPLLAASMMKFIWSSLYPLVDSCFRRLVSLFR